MSTGVAGCKGRWGRIVEEETLRFCKVYVRVGTRKATAD